MPSAPKYKKRRKGDFYPTPYWCTRALLDSYELAGRHSNPRNPIIVESSAGRGNISKIIKNFYPDCTLIQHELYRNKHLEQYGHVVWGDFLTTCNIIKPNVNYAIGNPPFTLSIKFIATERIKFPNAEVIKLLPLSLLGSKERNEWWKLNKPNKMSYLSDRPSFTGDGHSDSSVYAWFHWYPKVKSHIFDPPQFLSKGDYI